MSNKVLELCNITQRFGGLVAVSEVNLEVLEGEIVGLIGPNGAGKTTVFNDITGIYTPTEGKVMFCGKDITGMQVHDITALGMSRTFQNIRLFKNMTVLDNLRIGMHSRVKVGLVSSSLQLPSTIKSEKEITEECMRLLKLTGLASKADDLAGSLPYGPQRRLEIVRAMATGAKLLLLDEPAAGMNEQETSNLMSFIRKLKQLGYTVFLIEHDMKLVMNICERIYVQNHGVIIANGTAKEIQSNQLVIDAYLGTGVE